MLASLQFTKSLLVYTGIPGKVRKDDVAQKKELCSSATKVQLGSECHPGNMGFVYVELLLIDKAWAEKVHNAPKMRLSRCMLGMNKKADAKRQMERCKELASHQEIITNCSASANISKSLPFASAFHGLHTHAARDASLAGDVMQRLTLAQKPLHSRSFRILYGS